MFSAGLNAHTLTTNKRTRRYFSQQQNSKIRGRTQYPNSITTKKDKRLSFERYFGLKRSWKNSRNSDVRDDII